MANPKDSSRSPRATAAPTASPGAAPRLRRSHGRTTLAEVAHRAGVTPMTVSRVLREPQRVSEETRQRVQSALQATGYSPNKQAGMLASGRSHMVAAIVPHIANSIFSETVQGLSDALQPHGLELLLAFTNYSLDREEEQIRAVLGWSPSGLVLTGRRHSRSALALMQRAQADGLPVLEIWDHDPKDQSFAQIGFSHREVGKMMADHLLGRGFRDLVYVDSGVPEDFRAHERGQAFVQQAKAGGAQARSFQAERNEPMQAGRLALTALQGLGLPRALAFANDHLAAGAYLQATELGLDVPGQLAMLGFGDFPISAQLGSGISTVAVNRYDIGRECAEQLLVMLGSNQGLSVTPVNRVLQPRLIQRHSS